MILDEVTFSYRRRQPVLTGVSLEFTPGRTVLLGPNGAGKSTLFSLCCGSQVPSSGWIGLDAGRPSSPRELRHRVGLMRQNIRPIAGLSVHEQVTYCGWLMGLTLREASSRTDEILAAVDLMPKAQTRCGQLSGGQLRRVGLAQVLIGRPQVLLLDEPTAGLDPAQRIRLRTVFPTTTSWSSPPIRSKTSPRTTTGSWSLTLEGWFSTAPREPSSTSPPRGRRGGPTWPT